MQKFLLPLPGTVDADLMQTRFMLPSWLAVTTHSECVKSIEGATTERQLHEIHVHIVLIWFTKLYFCILFRCVTFFFWQLKSWKFRCVEQNGFGSIRCFKVLDFCLLFFFFTFIAKLQFMALWMAMSSGQSAYRFSPDWNISTSIGWIAMKICTGMQGA